MPRTSKTKVRIVIIVGEDIRASATAVVRKGTIKRTAQSVPAQGPAVAAARGAVATATRGQGAESVTTRRGRKANPPAAVVLAATAKTVPAARVVPKPMGQRSPKRL
jgi:hypothetical protein